MNSKRIVVMTVLVCAAVTFSYWLGQKHGDRFGGEFAPLTDADIRPEDRAITTESITRIKKRQMSIPPRDPAAKVHLIDLSSWYNAGLTGDWHGSAQNNDFATLPTGVQTFAGTEFDVRGLIQLRASDPGTAPYPRQVNGIPLGLRCRNLHFLHNTLFGRLVPSGQAIGAYVLHYSDGETVTVPLRMGENIFDWWGALPQMTQEGLTVPAWKGTNGLSARRGQSIYLNKFTWKNPRPDVELRAFDFVGETQMAGPFLVAVTAEP